jgi:hypothetical protein
MLAAQPIGAITGLGADIYPFLALTLVESVHSSSFFASHSTEIPVVIVKFTLKDRVSALGTGSPRGVPSCFDREIAVIPRDMHAPT